MAKVINPESIPSKNGSSYPPQFQAEVALRQKRQLGDAVGLSQFGVNQVSLPPGCASSQRHWHSAEDEFVYILKGELTLQSDAGETKLTTGMVAGFPANSGDGHRLINRSEQPAVYLEVGTRNPGHDIVEYSDIDMRAIPDGQNGYCFVHKDNSPY